MTTIIPTALILSSTVTSSRVGASAASFCLQRLGIETMVLPTTLMGRHPGWGTPGGGAVETKTLQDMWEAVKAQDIAFDAVLTGYMGESGHIQLGAKIIDHVKTRNPNALIAVDPVMGDHGRLYIPEDRANMLIETLIPRAGFITPNLWELEYIKRRMETLPDRLVTSVPFKRQEAGDEIGASWQSGETQLSVQHTKFEEVPHGGGDSLAALFLGRRLLGETSESALAKSVASIFEIMGAAHRLDMGELPLVRLQDCICDPATLEVQT